MQVKYKTRSTSEQEEGFFSSITFQGSHEEMTRLQSEHLPKSYFYPERNRSIGGRVKSVQVYQAEGSLWCCEFQFVANQHHEGTQPPDTTFGKKSAVLECGLLSMPLESHPQYRMHWNHYLATTGDEMTPLWWNDATNAIIPDNFEEFRWITSPDDLPLKSDGKTWKIVQEPTKKGVDSYDMATYMVRENVRCKTAKAAGILCANKLNKLISPENDFGIAGGNWKCDDIRISWTGKYWLASLTYTRSGNDKGWDNDLYSEGD